jgi:NADH dehydrogenase [ubiquinone] 1 alpha subcomplex assembly factor 7
MLIPRQTIANFKPLASVIDTIYMVEASKHLREAQHKLLCGEAALEETDIGFQSQSKYMGKQRIVWCEDMKFVPKGDQLLYTGYHYPNANTPNQ